MKIDVEAITEMDEEQWLGWLRVLAYACMQTSLLPYVAREVDKRIPGYAPSRPFLMAIEYGLASDVDLAQALHHEGKTDAEMRLFFEACRERIIARRL
jgi:hypothetical protein